jgi:hypothetical protein
MVWLRLFPGAIALVLISSSLSSPGARVMLRLCLASVFLARNVYPSIGV